MREKKHTQRRGQAKISIGVTTVKPSKPVKKYGVTMCSRSSTLRKAGKGGTPTTGGCSRGPKATKCSATPVTTKRRKTKTENGKLLNGKGLSTHSPEQCKGEWCCVHNPSPHHMRTWDRYYREDKGYLLERICPKHRVGHPDPDSLAHFVKKGIDWMGIHGCCGCCRKNDIGNL